MNSIQNVRGQFPALEQKIKGFPLTYLDSAATTLKPNVVVDRMNNFYLYESSNVHRGAHTLSDQATRHYEKAREFVAHFLGVRDSEQIIFTRGTTEAVNIVASSFAGAHLNVGDEILISEMEHHSNIVPWQLIAKSRNLKIKPIAIDAQGQLDFNDLEKKLSPKVKLVAVTGCSNVLGTFVDIPKLTEKVHAIGAKVLIDGAQLVSQKKIELEKWDVDFFAFSGHKIFGPTGIGVLFGKKDLLESMPPYQGGGSMISEVSFENTTFLPAPMRFEAGTPHIAGAIGLHAALLFFSNLNLDEVRTHEKSLLARAQSGLQEIGAVIYGNVEDKAPILSFNLPGLHHADIAQILDQQGVAVRAGHHCCQPLMKKLGIPGTVRASFSIYNSIEDVENFLNAVKKAKELLG